MKKKVIICTCLDFWGEQYQFGVICEGDADFENLVKQLKEQNTEIVDCTIIDAKEL